MENPQHLQHDSCYSRKRMKVDDRSDFDKGFQDGMRAAYREVEAWSKARLDRLEPGKNQRMRDEIEFAQVSLLHRLRHHLPIQHYPAAWSDDE